MNKNVSLTSRIKISDDIVSRNLQGEIVLLDLKTGSYYGLDVMGTIMWDLIQKHKSLEKVHDLLTEEYDIAEVQCTQDLLNFVSTLHDKKLIEC